MFELHVYNELKEMQTKMANLRKLYKPYLEPELSKALSVIHIRLDMAVDLAEEQLSSECGYSEEG